jgi:hypothetical protein
VDILGASIFVYKRRLDATCALTVPVYTCALFVSPLSLRFDQSSLRNTHRQRQRHSFHQEPSVYRPSSSSSNPELELELELGHTKTHSLSFPFLRFPFPSCIPTKKRCSPPLHYLLSYPYSACLSEEQPTQRPKVGTVLDSCMSPYSFPRHELG